jgi:phosphate transport system permease protein
VIVMRAAFAHRLSTVTEPLVELAIKICGWSAILFVALIFLFIFVEAAPALWGPVPLTELFTSAAWHPESEVGVRYGAAALVAGSVAVTALAMLLSVPAGLGAAIYVSEYCGRRTREALKVAIELLAAIPSVVWGFIGCMVLGPLIVAASGAAVGLNLLNGAVILAFMSIPVIMSMGEDALRSVPDAYREASLALGASRWQTIVRVLLPAARRGLLAAALLGIGRAIGETMAVLMATGHRIRIPGSAVDPVRTLTATIAAELGETMEGSDHYRALFVLGVLLMGISLAVNAAADLIVRGWSPSRRKR